MTRKMETGPETPARRRRARPAGTAGAGGTEPEAGAEGARITQLHRLTEKVITVRVEGVTPVIPHRWSEKAINMMQLRQQTPGVRPKREPRNPEEDAHDACYWLQRPGGVETPAMPATAFKAAMIGAVRLFDGITMTLAKVLFYVEGEGPEQLVALDGETQMRTDMPRNATGVADLRYRKQVWPWAATLRVHYLPSMTDAGSVIALLDAAGRGGIGDWRPSAPRSATGTYGQFRVEG